MKFQKSWHNLFKIYVNGSGKTTKKTGVCKSTPLYLVHKLTRSVDRMCPVTSWDSISISKSDSMT